MKRRQFLEVAAIGATAMLPSRPSLLAAAPPQAWQHDGVGSLARIGLLTPAFDPVPESEAWAMAPQGVSIHASRMRWQRGDALSSAQSPHVDSAAALPADLKPRAIM